MEIFVFTTASRPALGPTQPPIQWVPGALSLGVKRPWCEEVADGWKRLQNEELHNLDASPKVIRMTKSRRMRRTEYVARMEEIINGQPERKRQS
jgi:hypothetical protein